MEPLVSFGVDPQRPPGLPRFPQVEYADMSNRKQTYDAAAYVWPSYTGDEPRTRMFWPEGNGEWETVRKAGAKSPGHTWPRRPLWGYCNEGDPSWDERSLRCLSRGAPRRTSRGQLNTYWKP